jgi:transcription antitermination factor NusB
MQNNYQQNHAARLIAILSLYAYFMQDQAKNLVKIAAKITSSYHNKDVFNLELPEEIINEIELHSPDEVFLQKLLSLTEEKREEVENFIQSSLIERWNLNKLDQAIKSILILATTELLFNQEIDAKIVIDEYVTLTKCFYENSETGFVNKVLDSIANKIKTGS